MPLGLVLGAFLCVVGVAGVAAARRRSDDPRARVRLGGSLVLVCVGAGLVAMFLFRGGASQRSECDLACREWGLRDGRIARSRTSDARACFCGTDARAHQLYELTRFGSARPSTPPR